MGKSRTNATNVTLHPLGQAIWGHILKFTVEKSHTNATNVTLHLPGQSVWGSILKYILVKSQTNVTETAKTPARKGTWNTGAGNETVLSSKTFQGKYCVFIFKCIYKLILWNKINILIHCSKLRTRYIQFNLIELIGIQNKNEANLQAIDQNDLGV